MKTLGIKIISIWIIYKNFFMTLVRATSAKNEPLNYAFVHNIYR